MNQVEEKDRRIHAQRLVVGAVLETIAEQGDSGAPLGPMYAAMQAQGCSFQQWTSLLASMQRTGVVRLENCPVEEVPIMAHITQSGLSVLALLKQHRLTVQN